MGRPTEMLPLSSREGGAIASGSPCVLRRYCVDISPNRSTLGNGTPAWFTIR